MPGGSRGWTRLRPLYAMCSSFGPGLAKDQAARAQPAIGKSHNRGRGNALVLFDPGLDGDSRGRQVGERLDRPAPLLPALAPSSRPVAGTVRRMGDQGNLAAEDRLFLPVQKAHIRKDRPFWSLSPSENRILWITFAGGPASIIVGAVLVGTAIALARYFQPLGALTLLIYGFVGLVAEAGIILSWRSLRHTDWEKMRWERRLGRRGTDPFRFQPWADSYWCWHWSVYRRSRTLAAGPLVTGRAATLAGRGHRTRRTRPGDPPP